MRTEPSDVIAAETMGVGCVALSIALMTKTITATRADRLRLTVEQRLGATVRFDAPDGGGMAAIVAPMRSVAAAAA
jgi:hypothetical protein